MAGGRITGLRRLALWALILVVGTGIAVVAAIRTPYAAFSGETFVDVPRGAGVRRIAALLKQAGVIRSEWLFLAVRVVRPDAALQAGEYQFRNPDSVSGVFDRLARGDIFFYEVIIPEGSNLFDIGEIVERHGLFSAKEFRKAASNAALIRDLAPDAPSLEGYLFPATYRLTKHTTAAQLCKDMTDRFRRAWKALQTKEDVNATVTLASLVEKETGVSDERPLVASVFRNRMDRHIKLDCDPTTIYAALLDGRFRGTIFRSDLESRHPYNTYQHEGLPPGPIANPGMKSLEAAIHPAETSYLFFVARPDGSGGHVFSTDVDAHNRAVAEYRRGQQKGKAASPPPGNSRSRKPGAN